MRPLRRGLPFAVALLGLLLALPGSALAAKPTRVHDEWNDPPQTITDFCGVTGLTVTVQSQGTGDVWDRYIKSQGVYAIFSDHIRWTDTWTGPNGAVITVDANHHGHDALVTDNGDGTYTDIWTQAGIQFRVRTPDHTVYMDSGRAVFEFIYGDSGTPGDPSDDVFIAFVEQLKSTGREFDADWCAIAVPVFTA